MICGCLELVVYLVVEKKDKDEKGVWWTMLGSQVIILVASIFTVAIGIFLAYMAEYSWSDWVGSLGLVLLLVGIIFIAIVFVAPHTETVFIQETEPAYIRKIVATNSEAMINGRGSSIYGTGSFAIGHDNVFRVYQVGDDDGITLIEVPSNKTTIYYTKDGEEPSITFVNCLFTENRCFFWETREERRYEEVDRYILRVPEGTISDYTFD